MSKQYAKSKVIEKISQYFQNNTCKNLYKDGCINYVGVTKDTKEDYSKVIVDYLVEHIDEFKKELNKVVVKRESSYKTNSHNGKSNFDFNKRPKGERREEKIAHAMFCQYKEKPAVFGKILDYQIPLKRTEKDSGVGKIDLLSTETYKINNEERSKIYILELKKDYSKETLLRCILEAYTYSKIVNRQKLCKDFSLNYESSDFIIAPLIYVQDDFKTQIEIVKPLINALDETVEIFFWEYDSGKYLIEKII